ncbi:hypothetical protein GF357_00420 [Candidatus Dojkabacteria bacterium]|nr:hypothetical protein [Candidatus Dojkabacteria bacterium]
MAVKTELHQGEQVIREEEAKHVVGKIRCFVGKIALTNQRVIFEKIPAVMGAFGVMGYSIAKLLNIYKPDFSIQLSNVASYEQSQFGLNKKCILFKTNDGNEYKFTVSSSFAEWKTTLDSMK